MVLAMFKTILVAVDGSSYSDKAIATACDLVTMYEADLHLVHTSNYQYYVTGTVAGDGMAIIPQKEFEKAGKDILTRTAEKVSELGCLSVKSHYVSDFAGRAIVDKANEINADLIILGSKGHSDIAGLLLGSVSHKVCNTAQCSCLIVR